jgi:hypothetical protein
MARRLGTIEGFGRYYDFRDGVVGGVSDRQRRVRHLRLSDNLLGRPERCMGSVRGGSLEAQNSALPDEPTSGFKYVPASGVSRLIVHTKADLIAGSGKLFSVTPGAAGVTQLTPPAGFTLTDKDWDGRQINSALFLTQRGDAQAPLMFSRHATGGTYALEPMTLTVPTLTGTATIAASATGVDAGYHWWRIRYLYRNGASKAITPFPVGGRNVTAGNLKVTIGGLLDGVITAANTQDWFAWVIERTTLATIASLHYTGTLGVDAMPDARAQWHFVKQGTSATYDDMFADADLWDVVDDGIFGDPQHVEGLVLYRDRLVGWNGNRLYVSQAVGDAMGTGPCNWDPDNDYPIGDDTDDIQVVLEQVDRLVAIKTQSVHPFEGDDPSTFRTYPIPQSAGAIGPRAAATFGTQIVMFDGAGLNRMSGNKVEPWGHAEVDHYLQDVNDSLASKSRMVNYAGELMMLAYPSSISTVNEQAIVYDFLTKQFRHFTNWRIRDAIIQSDDHADFGGSTMLFLDQQKVGATLAYDANPSFVTWLDARSATVQVYVQKLLNGVPQWTANGVQVGAATTGAAAPVVVSDGGTGCIVVWCESRGVSVDVWAQKFDSTGAKQWAAGTGIQITTAAGTEAVPKAYPDGAGGVYIVWIDARSGTHLYAQRLNSAGAAQWTPLGVLVDTFAGSINSPSIRGLLDSSGNFYVMWAEGALSARVQKLDSTGTKLWAVDGVNAGTGPLSSTQAGYAMCLDGLGGLFIVRNPGAGQIVVTKVSSAEVVTSSGNLDTTSSAGAASLVADGAGGCFVCWSVGLASAARVRAHRLNAALGFVWDNSINLSTTVWVSNVAHISGVPDGAGGIIWAWDIRVVSTNAQVFAQRATQYGEMLWGATGVPVCTLATSSEFCACCTDAANGCIIIWSDKRVDTGDVYTQRVGPLGSVFYAVNGIAIATPANAQSQPQIAFTGTAEGAYPPALAGSYRIWRAFQGTKDEVLYDGSGGMKIPVRSVTPSIDDGEPDTLKNLERLHFEASGGASTLSAVVTCEPGSGAPTVKVAAPLIIVSGGAIFGDESPTIAASDLVFANEDGSPVAAGIDEFAGEETAFVEPIGLPPGTTGLRYSVELFGEVDEELTLLGFTVDGRLLPSRPLSKASA